MPELPEVETTARGLRASVLDKRVARIELRRRAIRFPIPDEIVDAAAGQKIIRIDRFSKYLLLVLEDGGRILVHLGMSGRLSYHADKKYVPAKHDHVILHFTRGGVLVFNDARRFGVVDYLPPSATTHKLLDVLGIDPLSEKMTPEFLLQKFKNKKTTMKAMLMDQKHIAGLGNIYVCEALFHAHIWPEREAGTLTKTEAKKLVPAIQSVLEEAITAGGSSLRDYAHVGGELGYFQDSHAVYGREGEPCRNCGKEIVRFTQNGRSTFACPKCQK